MQRQKTGQKTGRGRRFGVFCVVLGLLVALSAWGSIAAGAAPAINRLVFTTGSDTQIGYTDIREYDNDGQLPKTLLSVPGSGVQPALSPDGTWLAYSQSGQLALYNLVTQQLGTGIYAYQVTSAPAWSHSGTQIAFATGDAGSGSIDRATVDATGVLTVSVRSLGSQPGVALMPAWSPDDSQIVFITAATSGPTDRFGQYPQTVSIMSAVDGSSVRQLTNNDTGLCLDRWPSYLDSGRVIFDSLCANTNSRATYTVNPVDGSSLALFSLPLLTDWNVTVSADGAFVATECGVPEGGTHICMVNVATGARADFTQVYGFNGDNINFQVASSTPIVLPPAEPLHIALMGDSVGAGEGIGYSPTWVVPRRGQSSWSIQNPMGVWIDDGSTNATACHRTDQSYQPVVAKALSAKTLFLSCTGSSATDGVMSRRVFDSGLTVPPQLGSADGRYGPANLAYDAFKPDVVLLTLGADDVHFADVLQDCYMPQLIAGALCRNTTQISQDMGLQAAGLRVVLDEIQQRGRADGKVPEVVLTTYFNPFSTQPGNCVDIRPGGNIVSLSRREITWIQSELTALNGSIKTVAASYANVKVVDITNVMKGHELCSADPWVYGPSIRVNRQFRSNDSPFHPTPSGQNAIAKLVISSV